MAKKLKNTTPEIDEWDEFEFFDLDNMDDLTTDTKDKTGLKYVKNVLKSVKNLTVKIGEALLPDTTGLAGELLNAGSEFRDQFTEYKDKALEQISKLKGGNKITKEALSQEAVGIVKDLKEDVKTRFQTGKFVKGPEDETFDFGFDDDDDDGEYTPSSSDNNAEVKQAKDPNAPVKARITAANKRRRFQFDIDNERFQSLREATVGSMEASVAASVDMFQKTQMLEEARHHVTTQYLKNIATNLYKLTGIEGQALAAHVEYGKKSLALYADLTRFTKEMHEMQSAIYQSNQKFKESRKKSTSKMSDVFGYGWSGSEWAKAVVGNAREAIEMSPVGMMMGMLPMMNMLGDMGGKKKGPLGQMLQFFNPLNLVLNATMSSKMKKSRERIEKMFGALPQLINQRFLNMADESGFAGLLGSILGIRDEEGIVRTDKYANMNLDDATSFDVRTKRTINEVIPTYLAQIAAGVTGQEETRYDFKTGKLRSISSIKREREAIQKQSLHSDYDFSKNLQYITSSGLNDVIDTQYGYKSTDSEENKKKRSSNLQYMKHVKVTQRGIESIALEIVQQQKGFDWERAKISLQVRNPEELRKASSDADYYFKQMTKRVSGSEEQKWETWRAFLAGYDNMLRDPKNPGGANFFKAGSALVKGNLNRNIQSFSDNLAENYAGGLNALSTMQHGGNINKLKTELQFWERKLAQANESGGYIDTRAAKARKVAIQTQLAQIQGETGGGFVNSASVDPEDNFEGFVMEQKYLSVPNMLKNITELLINGIVVYPVNKIPEKVLGNLKAQSKYLSTQSADVAKAYYDQIEEEARVRKEALEAQLEERQYKRDWTLEKETGVAATPIGRLFNKLTGGIYNVLNQTILSPLVGFDGTVDFASDTADLESSAGVMKDKTGAVRSFAEKYHGMEGWKGKLANFLYGITASVDKSVENIVASEKSGKEDLGDKVISKVTNSVDNMKAAVKEKIDPSKHSWLEKIANGIKSVFKQKPEQAVEAFKQADSTIKNTGSVEQAFDELAQAAGVDSSVLDGIENNMGMSGGGSNVNILSGNKKSKSKAVDKRKQYFKTINTTTQNFTTQALEARLDRIIEIMEQKREGDPESGGYVVQGMDEVISLLVTMNSNLLSPKEMGEIAGDINKKSGKKKSILKKIVGLPIKAAGKIKDAALWTAGKASGAAKHIGGIAGGLLSGVGAMLPGVGNFLKGAAGGAFSLLKGAGGALFGGAKWAGKGLFGLAGKGVNKAAQFLTAAKARVRKELDELAENGGLNIDTILAKFDREALLDKVSSITGKPREELEGLDNKQLAQELLKFWKSKAGLGIGGVVEGLGNAVKGAFGFGKEALKQGAGAAKGVAKAAWDTTKSVGHNLAKMISGENGVLGGFGLFGGGKLKPLLTGILANSISIRGMLETKFGIPSNISAAQAEAEQVAKSGKGLVGGIGGAIGSMFRGAGNLLKGLGGKIKGAFGWAKGKIAGFRDRGDGSGISEGSYEDFKKDKEEARVEEREENNEENLAIIAESTSAMAGTLYKAKFGKDKDGKEKKPIKLGGALGAVLGGGALLAGGAALMYGHNKIKNQRAAEYDAMVESGQMTESEASREKKFDTIEKGHQMLKGANIALRGGKMVLNGLSKLLGKFFGFGPLKKFFGKGLGTTIQKIIMGALTKLAPRLGPRLAALAGTVSNPIGWTAIIAQAAGGFVWGMARAKHYFRSMLQDGGKVTLAMRLASGLIKALDTVLFGLLDIIAALGPSIGLQTGGNAVMMVYGWIKPALEKGDPKVAAAAAGVGTAAASMSSNETAAIKEAENEMQLTMKEPEVMDEPNIPEIPSFASQAAAVTTTVAATGLAVGHNPEPQGTNIVAETSKSIEKAKINYFYANVASLANLISIRKLLELQNGYTSDINADQMEAEKVASTGEALTAMKSDSLLTRLQEGAKRQNLLSRIGGAIGGAVGAIGSGIKNIAGKIGQGVQNLGGRMQNAATVIESNAMNYSGPAQNLVQTAGTGAAKVVGATGGALKTIYEKGKGFLMSNPLTKNLFPKQSPSPYLIPNPQQSAGGARADIMNVNPVLRERIAAFAQHYYDITGKPLYINSAKRSFEQQKKMWEAQSRVKWTGDRSKDTAATIAAGGKFFGVNGGTVGYPNPNASHVAGRGIDISIAETPYNSEVNSDKRHWLFDDILEQYGLKRTLVRANGYTGGSPERWHISLDSNASVALPKEDPPEASIAEQKMDGIEVTIADPIVKNLNAVQSSATGAYNNSIKPIVSYADNTISKAASTVSSTVGRISQATFTSDTGINDANRKMEEVGNLSKLMEKIEDNTRKSAEVLAEHLPNLGNILQVLGAILQATMNQPKGGSVTNPDADMAAAIIAKANY